MSFMVFHLGKPVLVMLAVSIIAGVWIAARPNTPRKDLTFWVFATSQYHDYLQLLSKKSPGRLDQSVNVDLIPARAMDMRLPVMFMSPGQSRDLPDVVEVPAISMAIYLRPPVDQIGFLPLNHYLNDFGLRQIDSLDAPGEQGWNARLATDGNIYTYDGRKWAANPARHRPDAWIDRILPSRLAFGTKDGHIFGVPHDVHPVVLAFREDLFRQAGTQLVDQDGNPTCSTWPQLQDKCLRFQEYWRQHGQATRHALELPQNNASVLAVLLGQRRIELVSSTFSNRLNDPKVAQTVAFYAQMVAGSRRIGYDTQPDSALEYRDFAEGNLCAMVMPDWKLESFRRSVPEIAGKMRMIPLPRFDASDAPTAGYGGTLICIPRGTRHPDDAWRLIEYLYFSPQSTANRQQLGIIPPVPETWTDPVFHQPDPYFGGQKTLELYINLAPQVPATNTSPLNTMALLTLGYVQSRSVAYLQSHGPDSLQPYCQSLLDSASRDLQRRIDHSRFD